MSCKQPMDLAVPKAAAAAVTRWQIILAEPKPIKLRPHTATWSTVPLHQTVHSGSPCQHQHQTQDQVSIRKPLTLMILFKTEPVVH